MKGEGKTGRRRDRRVLRAGRDPEFAEGLKHTLDQREEDGAGKFPEHRRTRAYKVGELPDNILESIQTADYGPVDLALEKLMDGDDKAPLPPHRPTREALWVHELSEEEIESLRNADFSHLDPELDKLMDEQEGPEKSKNLAKDRPTRSAHSAGNLTDAELEQVTTDLGPRNPELDRLDRRSGGEQ